MRVATRAGLFFATMKCTQQALVAGKPVRAGQGDTKEGRRRWGSGLGENTAVPPANFGGLFKACGVCLPSLQGAPCKTTRAWSKPDHTG